MRREKHSKHARAIQALAYELQIKLWSDPSWSLVEAGAIETPQGEVHLHWTNHRGIGRWNIITHPQWRGELCGTVRCRRVVIIPHGGENEAVPIKAERLEDIQDKWLKLRYGEFEPTVIKL